MSIDLAPTAEQQPSLLSAYAISEIKALMGRHDLNKTELARRLGVSDMWVGRRLRGDIPIGLDELQRIAIVLDTDPMELLPERRSGRITRSSVDPLAARVVATIGETRPSRVVRARTARRHRPGRAVARTRPVSPLSA